MLSSFIKQKRLTSGFTQEYLASKLGVSRPTYRLIEDGKREITIPEARKLASLFDIAISDFISEDDSRPRITIERAKSHKKNEIRVTKKNFEKFRQIFLYILECVGAKPNIGEGFFHHLLYFIDFDYYEKNERSIMGLTYLKTPRGPKAIEFESLILELQNSNEIELVKSKVFRFDRKKYLPLNSSLPLESLSADEIKHVDDVLARISDKSASDMERYSLQDVPVRAAADGEEIEYEAVFYRDDKYSVRSYDDEI
ncbi:MAG: helix-turn-helix domain-containing protein [Planctomycetes bacterium]|nr:helix-turn-helix domain-containing protein [Planctomycetota bacterium]